MFYKINRRGSRIAVSFTDNDSAARIAFRSGAGTLAYCVPVNNADEIGRAKRAVEIGLDVAIPAPVYPALVDRALYDRLVEELFDQAAIVEDAEFGTPRLDFSGVTVPAPLVRGCAYSRNAVSAPTDVGADANVYVSYTYTSGFDGDMPYTAEYAEKYGVGDAALAAIAAAAETARLRSHRGDASAGALRPGALLRRRRVERQPTTSAPTIGALFHIHTNNRYVTIDIT